MKREGRFAETAFSWTAFGALFLFFFIPLLLLKKTFINGDYWPQHLPWAKHLADSLRSGALPVWTDLMACGFPFVAEGQSGPFYPLHLAYVFLPFLLVYTWSIPLHMLLGGGGMYTYVRRLGISRPASGLAATVFTFGSGYAGCFYNIGSLRTLSWLPWALWLLLVSRTDEKRLGFRAVAPLAVIFYMQWTAGFSQIAVYSFFYCLMHELWALRGVKPLVVFCSSLLLGTALSAPQIAATAELIPLSIRHSESLYFALWGSVNPLALVSLIFPEWGNALRVSFYAGIVPLALVISMTSFSAPKGVWRHVFLAGLFFFLSLGGFNPIYRWVIEHFSITIVRNPSKFLFFSVTSIAVLSAYALDRVVKVSENGDVLRRWKMTACGILFVTALLPAVGALLRYLLEPHWLDFSEKYIVRIMTTKGVSANSYEHYAHIMADFFEHLRRLFSSVNPLNWNAVLLVAASVALLYCYLQRKITKRLFLLVLFILLTFDLGVFGTFLGTGFIGNASSVTRLQEPFIVSEMRKDAGIERPIFVEFSSSPTSEVLSPNAGILFDVVQPGGYSPLLLRSYYELTYDLGWVDGSLGRAPVSEAVWTSQRGLIDLLGTRYVLSDRPLNWDGFKQLSTQDGRWLYRNESAMPKVAGYYSWRTGSREENLRFIKTASFDPHSTVLIEKTPNSASIVSGSEYQPAYEVKNEMNGHVSARIRMKHAGIVLVRANAYPGWKAWLNGMEVPWFVADHAFIGVAVPEGESLIEWRYAPTWKRLSDAVSVGAVMILLVLIWIRRRK